MSPSIDIKVQKRYDEFIKYGLNDKQALYLLKLMYELTPRGFEEYVRRYFYHAYGIRSKVTGGYTDGGVDIIASYHNAPLLVQCKKWANRHIKKAQILEFRHNVQHHPQYKDGTKAVRITTNRVSKEAQAVAKEFSIAVRDYTFLLQWKQQYSIEMFANEVQKHKKYFRPYTLYFPQPGEYQTVNHKKSIWETVYNFFVQ